MSLLKFDDSKVEAYIRETLADGTVRTYAGISKLSQAHAAIYVRRGKEDPNDDNDELAATEHY